MRVLFALSGLHRTDRGAETAFISVATELSRLGAEVTLIGSGPDRSAASYRYARAASVRRERFERFPSLPLLRNDCAYEELTFGPALFRRYRPAQFDITLTCSYPFTNWILRRPRLVGPRPPHVFVTQNGDWPACAGRSEYRFFACEGLVCTNPDMLARNKDRWNCRLIPNGIDGGRFHPGESERSRFGLPAGRLVVLMVSALVPVKRVEAGIEAVSRIPDAHLVVAGDGPLRDAIDAQAAELLAGRFTRLTVQAERMPALYRSADVFLHLCTGESFGNVYLEALASGLPVVAHECSVTRWILGNDGFLLDTQDPAAVARYIDLARQATSPGQIGRVLRAAEFSLSQVGKMYLSFLEEVIAGIKSGPANGRVFNPGGGVEVLTSPRPDGHHGEADGRA